MPIKNFNVGPAQLFWNTSDYIYEILNNGVATTPHRSEKFSEIYDATQSALKEFFHIPEDYKIFFTYSATDSMDILLSGCVYNDITQVSNGIFWDLFTGVARDIWAEPHILTTNTSHRVDPKDINDNNDILTITANDTSTGIAYDQENISQIRSQNPQSLFFIDATSSFWAIEYNISSADAWLFSIQKCFGLPSWLWVLIVNKKVLQRAEEKKSKGQYIGGHNSLIKLDSFYQKFHTPATPNIVWILGLYYVVQEFICEFKNISQLEKNIQEKAEYIYKQIEKLTDVRIYNTGEWRSLTTIVIEADEEKIESLTRILQKNDYSVSPWLWNMQGKTLRIANFPVHTIIDFEVLFSHLQ